MNAKRLTLAESLMLDIIRVSASVVVAFGHLTQPYFSTGWRDLTTFGQCAVAIFFILSGFVIREVTTSRASTLRGYVGDRLSRVYSVAVPALLITMVTDGVAHSINPTFYRTVVAFYHHPWQPILVNLAFCGQIWNHLVDPLSNSPYWSVNYEVAYYLAYGFFFYLTGVTRWFAIAVLCLAVGTSGALFGAVMDCGLRRA